MKILHKNNDIIMGICLMAISIILMIMCEGVRTDENEINAISNDTAIESVVHK